MSKLYLLTVTVIFLGLLNFSIIPIAYSQTIDANLEFKQGQEIFTINCAGCHPNGANIIRRNKNLRWKTLEKNGYNSIDSIENIITHGKNNMSPFFDRLTPEEINLVAKYVFSQAQNNWQQ